MGVENKWLREALAGQSAPPTNRQLDQLAEYLELVAQYSATLNLTGFGGDAAQLAGELVGEAVRLLKLGEIVPATHAVDLGSGNGSPVVPLAVLCPAVDFTAVESRTRRAAFLRTVQARLGLANLEVHAGRVEQLAKEQPAGFDLATSRAFAPLDKLLPLARDLLAGGGQLRGYLGEDAASLEQQAAAHLFRRDFCQAYTLNGSVRHIYQLTKL